MGETRWEHVRVERTGGGDVALVTLDAGRGNVITTACLRELREVVAVLDADGALRALLLDHAGEHFSYGASIEEHRPDAVAGLLAQFRALARDLLGSGLPTVCAVRGRCLGGGLELASLCDRVVAAPDARFGQPEIRLGVFAPIGSALLPRIVGPKRALDLLQSGREVGADEALALGLVAEIAGDPGAAALAWIAEHLAPKSASSLRHATRAARATWCHPFLQELERLEQDYLGPLMRTRDAREGVEAFLAKRPP